MMQELSDRIKTRYKNTKKFLKKQGEVKASLYILGVLLAAAPVVTMCVLLVAYSVNAPFWDQWIYADLYTKLKDGTLTIRDLWLQHNEHRIMFPKAFQMGMAALTNWNIRFEVVFNFIFALGTFTFMLLMLRRTFQKKPALFVGVAAAIALLLFSPVQWINWIWGFQLAWFMSVFVVAFTLWLLTKANATKFDWIFLVALLGGVVATYSMGNGLLVWAAGFVVLIVRQLTREQILTWLGIGAVVSASYFYKFERTPHGSMRDLVLHRPLEILDYVFTYLGRSVATTQPGARNTGIALFIILLVSVFFLYKRRQLPQVAGFLGFATYGLLTAALASLSRLGEFGIQHSMVFSYTTMSTLFVIGTVATGVFALSLYVGQLSKKNTKQLLLAGVLSGFIAFPLISSSLHNYNLGIDKLTEQAAHLRSVEECIYRAKSADDECLLKAFPHKDVVWEKIQNLQRVHWGNFR